MQATSAWWPAPRLRDRPSRQSCRYQPCTGKRVVINGLPLGKRGGHGHGRTQEPVRNQADRAAPRDRRRHEPGERHRRTRPHRPGHRGDHRNGHLRDHRRGDRRVRARPRDLVRARGRDLHLLRALLRRAGIDHSGVRLRLHLRVRDDGRGSRLDHRLGPDPGVRSVGGCGGGRLGRLSHRAVGLAVRDHAQPTRSRCLPATAEKSTSLPSSWYWPWPRC